MTPQEFFRLVARAILGESDPLLEHFEPARLLGRHPRAAHDQLADQIHEEIQLGQVHPQVPLGLERGRLRRARRRRDD